MSNLVLPKVPVVFEIRMQGSITDMDEVQAASWLQGKLSTINLNGTLEIKVRRLTPEELARFQVGLAPGSTSVKP